MKAGGCKVIESTLPNGKVITSTPLPSAVADLAAKDLNTKGKFHDRDILSRTKSTPCP
jgi:hypothetical protein